MSSGGRFWRIFRQVLAAVALLAVLVLLMAWLSGAFVRRVEPGPPVAVPEATVSADTTRQVQRLTFPLTIEQVGTIQTDVKAQVASRIVAQVKEVNVREGDMVAGPYAKDKGPTVLARLDDRDIQEKIRRAESEVLGTERAIDAAKSSLEKAKTDVEATKARQVQTSTEFGRIEQIYRKGVASESDLDNARAAKAVADAQVRGALQGVEAAQHEIQRLQAAKQQAEAALAEAKVLLTYTVLTAPFNGRVIRKTVDAGSMVAPGQPLFLLESPCCPELHAVVSESLAPRLKIGEQLQVRIDSLGRSFDGLVREIAPQADPTTRTVIVKITLAPNPDLVSGLFGRMAVALGTYSALVVPKAAVRPVGQLDLVQVVDAEGHARRRFVTLGDRHDGLVEVDSGLDEGERVVVP
jgi:multidrug resistance efflux pump